MDYSELVNRIHSQAVYLPEKFSKNAELLDVLMKAADAIEELQAAVEDVQPVRHGRWIQHYEPYDTGEEWIEAPYGFECSECGRWEVEQEPFCNCGAKMDKEEE